MLLADDVLEVDSRGKVLEALRTCLFSKEDNIDSEEDEFSVGSIRAAQNTDRVQDRIMRGFLPRIQELADLTQNLML